MHNRLSTYLEARDLITDCQYGFRKSHSTIHPIILAQNFITEALNNKQHVIGVFCDLRKAFDCVDHKLLLNKLSKMGVAGTELKWFASYLEGRSQFVSLGEIISKTLTINIGVPQGSILGPLLFLVYINDLPNCTNLKTFLFADDTNLLAAGENIIELFEKVREEFGKVSQYFFRNKLSLHPSKTKLIVFTNSQTAKNYRGSVTINFNNNNENNPDKIHQISCMYGNESGEAIRFLGMYFDPSLNFKYHINYLSKTVICNLFH